jgi:hypothetical protein
MAELLRYSIFNAALYRNLKLSGFSLKKKPPRTIFKGQHVKRKCSSQNGVTGSNALVH